MTFMKRPRDPQKEIFWQNHMMQSELFDGSMTKYCKQNGINIHLFKYWRNRLSKKAGSSRLPVPVPFAEVRVAGNDESPGTKIGLPDPKWLADLIMELQGKVK